METYRFQENHSDHAPSPYQERSPPRQQIPAEGLCSRSQRREAGIRNPINPFLETIGSLRNRRTVQAACELVEVPARYTRRLVKTWQQRFQAYTSEYLFKYQWIDSQRKVGNAVQSYSPTYIYIFFLIHLYFAHCVLLQKKDPKDLIRDKLATYPAAQAAIVMGYIYCAIGIYRFFRKSDANLEQLSGIHRKCYWLFHRGGISLLLYTIFLNSNVSRTLQSSLLMSNLAAVVSLVKKHQAPGIRCCNYIFALNLFLAVLVVWRRGDFNTIAAAFLLCVGEFFAQQIRAPVAWVGGYSWHLLMDSYAVILLACAITSVSPYIITGGLPDSPFQEFYAWAYKRK